MTKNEIYNSIGAILSKYGFEKIKPAMWGKKVCSNMFYQIDVEKAKTADFYYINILLKDEKNLAITNTLRPEDILGIDRSELVKLMEIKDIAEKDLSQWRNSAEKIFIEIVKFLQDELNSWDSLVKLYKSKKIKSLMITSYYYDYINMV